MEDFIQRSDFTNTDLLAVIYQLFNALYLAQRLWGFLHCDFFDRNWLIREMQEPIAIPYYGTHETATRWIVTRYVPCIIDYGMSRAVIGGVQFVSPTELKNESGNFYRDRWALSDIESLLFDLSNTVHEFRDPVLHQTIESLQGFIENRIGDIRGDVEEDDREALPFSIKDFEEFLLFAETTLPPPVVTTIPPGCWSFQSQQQVLTDCDFYARFGTPKALSAFAYCQTLNAARAVSPEQYNLVRQDINYYNAWGVFRFEFVPRVWALEKELGKRLTSNPFIPSIRGKNKRALNEKFQQDYAQRIATLEEMYIKLQDLIVQLKANHCALNEQEVSPSACGPTFEEMKDFLKRTYDRFQREHGIIDDNTRIAREKGIEELVFTKAS